MLFRGGRAGRGHTGATGGPAQVLLLGLVVFRFQKFLKPYIYSLCIFLDVHCILIKLFFVKSCLHREGDQPGVRRTRQEGQLLRKDG